MVGRQEVASRRSGPGGLLGFRHHITTCAIPPNQSFRHTQVMTCSPNLRFSGRRGDACGCSHARLAQLAANRSIFYRELASGPFYGFNRPGAKSSEAIIQNWWRQGMMGGAKAHYDGIVAFSQTDFTEDLKKITVPVLVMHGDDDQIVPYADSAPLSAKLLKNGTLKTYKGFPHGMPTTQADTINADLLAFFKA